MLSIPRREKNLISRRIINLPNIKESPLYESLSNKKVRCELCPRRCLIPDKKFGMCKTHVNIDGTLYTVTYGDISSVSCNPIEKKPFFHFWPGSKALTIGSWSCNLLCPWCQNYEISKVPPNPTRANYLSPVDFIKLTLNQNCEGVSFSFNEPIVSLFEYSLDVMPLAKRKGLYTTYVSNGFATEEAIRMLAKNSLDAINIDIKGCGKKIERYIGAKVEHSWNAAIEAKKSGIHVEITTLIIPGVNDDETCLRSIATKIYNDLGSSTPWHVTRYFPSYKSRTFGLDKHTPVDLLEFARNLGKDVGLKYVYIGNVPGHKYENTYCPVCNSLLIRRYIFSINQYNLLKDAICPSCGYKVDILGSPILHDKKEEI